MRTTTWRTMGALAALLAACSGGGSAKDDPDPGGTDAGVDPIVPGFSADALPEGRALWIDGALDGADVTVTVRGRQLGDAFGLSVHLTWDDGALALDDSEPPATRADVLDPDDGGEAVTIARAATGDLALGGTRTSAEAGEVELADELTLATVRLRARAANTSRLELGRAVVARLDGRLEPVPVAGGTLVVVEEAP